MIKIGDFAKMFDVSIKTVRFYEQKGLLKPCFVDVYSGYRYYNEKNIEEMTVVLNLKSLGFSLEEIREYEPSKLEQKVTEYSKEIERMKNKIHILETFSKREGSISKMKKFINDNQVIGKWKLLGVAKHQSDAEQRNFVDDDFNIQELYFLPEGQSYWVFSWTKGYLYINDVENEYEVKDGTLYVFLLDPISGEVNKVAVFENVDHKEYEIADIVLQDNTNVPFVEDPEISGIWNVVDLVTTKDQFIPGKRYHKNDLWLKKIMVSLDGTGIMVTRQGNNDFHYTKGFFTPFCSRGTLAKYEYLHANGKTYLIVEWKNGDYIFGKRIPSYYVFEKEAN